MHARAIVAAGVRRAPLRWLGAIVVVGAALRISQVDQALYADELWTYVGASQANLGAVLDWVGSEQEVTPPLNSVLAWLSGQLGDAAAWIRLPSQIAGIVTIPLVYLLGDRLFDQRVGLLAAALTALSPFLIWHSVEARVYAVTIAFTMASTLALLYATESRHTAWWIAYAALSCAAMYSHYTASFVLAAQALWCIALFPSARLAALAANAVAAAVFAFWTPGMLDDFGSSTQEAYNLLIPFTLGDSVSSLERLFGHPFAPFESFAGSVGAAALIIGIAVGAGGWVAGVRLSRKRLSKLRARPEIVLVVALAIAGPGGAALASALGTHMFLPRNISGSLPALIIAISALALVGPLAFRIASSVLLLGAFAGGAVAMTESDWQRPAFEEAAAYIDENADRGDVVLEAFPFPLGVRVENPDGPAASSLRIQYGKPHPTIDYLAEGPRDALSRAEGRDLFLVGDGQTLDVVRAQLGIADLAPYRTMVFDGLIPVTVDTVRIPPAT